MYKLYHYPLELEYYFVKRPDISDMVYILNKLGYEMKGNKIISDNNGIPCEHNTREEFKITKIKFSDRCKCDPNQHECCDICTGWEEAKRNGKLKDRK